MTQKKPLKKVCDDTSKDSHPFSFSELGKQCWKHWPCSRAQVAWEGSSLSGWLWTNLEKRVVCLLTKNAPQNRYSSVDPVILASLQWPQALCSLELVGQQIPWVYKYAYIYIKPWLNNDHNMWLSRAQVFFTNGCCSFIVLERQNWETKRWKSESLDDGSGTWIFCSHSHESF